MSSVTDYLPYISTAITVAATGGFSWLVLRLQVKFVTRPEWEVQVKQDKEALKATQSDYEKHTSRIERRLDEHQRNREIHDGQMAQQLSALSDGVGFIKGQLSVITKEANGK